MQAPPEGCVPALCGFDSESFLFCALQTGRGREVEAIKISGSSLAGE